jgi:hypothetical protein
MQVYEYTHTFKVKYTYLMILINLVTSQIYVRNDINQFGQKNDINQYIFLYIYSLLFLLYTIESNVCSLDLNKIHLTFIESLWANVTCTQLYT